MMGRIEGLYIARVWWLGTVLFACRPDPVAVEETTLTATSQGGEVQLEFAVEDGTAVLAALESEGLLGVDRLEGPSGTVLEWTDWLGEEQLTTAVFASPRQQVLNWPVRDVDPGLESGLWTLTVSVFDDALQDADGVDVTAVIRQKTDTDLRNGTLRARVLVPADLEPALADGASAAVDRWIDVWRRHGLTLDVEIVEAELPLQVPDLFEGDSQVRDAVSAHLDVDLVAWVGEDLATLPNALGHAGSVPNASFDAPRALLGLAALQAAGTDATFSDEEIRLFGEVMAHEAAHFLGLFHPVELDFTRRDALDDTETCSGRDACEAALGGNLMFPYPVCGSGTCVEADDLTRDQRTVAHGYVGVR